jgi:hypothetical protein
MNELEINWRQLEYGSIAVKIEYLRYKQAKLDELGTSLFSKTQTLASKTREFDVYFSHRSWSTTMRFIRIFKSWWLIFMLWYE